MRLNQELRSPRMTRNHHLLWILLYVVLIAAIAVFLLHEYREHSQNQLPSGHIELKVSKKRYQPKEIVSFSVTNYFPTAIYVENDCPSEPLHVYKWENNTWIQIRDEAKEKLSSCYKQGRRVAVAANSSVTYNYKDWPELFAKPGVYRLVMKIDHYNELPFQDFVVLEPRKVIQQPTQTIIPQTPTLQPSTVQSTEDESEDRQENELEEEDEQEIEDD